MAIPVSEWIQENFKESARIEQDTIDVVADFALIWNLFEGVECSTRAGIQQFERFANSVSDQVPDALLNELLTFWKYKNKQGEWISLSTLKK